MPSARSLRSLLIGVAVLMMIIPSIFCKKTQEWKNVYDTSAHYVGMNTCRTCHEEVYKTFIKTGMGQSFDHATRQKSAADFTPAHALVYDSSLDYYYKPFWDKDSLCIMEFRIEHGDTVHKLTRKIDYIVGSGQHTNSHIYSINGYLHQAPVTFYTQKQQWDLAPGFEKGANTRFGRMIELECMSCHNAYPQFVNNSQNKYAAVQTGIDCERCHGPGSLHVADKMVGKVVDTSLGPDYTIVNPRRLSTELQNNICQRCHLQGIAVLNDGKTFFDFRPGMKLSEVMNVFMPEYEGAQDKMIMASHVERMKKSKCFTVSNNLSCITCHNPHISVKYTERTQYINACNTCHGKADQHQCTQNMQARLAKNNDCITCHMPHNSSIDIPHVAVTDHFIRKDPAKDTMNAKITGFFGLKCFNNDHPGNIATARGFVEFFERYAPSNSLLDSALKYLANDKKTEAKEEQNRDLIRVYYLMSDYNKVSELANELQPLSISDAWTAYRIGKSYFQLQQPDKALPWLERAVAIWKYSLDFENEYATCLLTLNRTDDALAVFNFIIQENPDYISANTNLGNLYLQKGDNAKAYYYMAKAEQLDPDHRQNLINMAVWYHNNHKPDEAKKVLEHLLKKHSGDVQAIAMLHDL